MGLRFRKSIKITKGIRLNLNKKSTSVTFGRGIVKHTINSKGKKTRTVKLPGSGYYYTDTIKKGNKYNDNNEKVYSSKTYKIAGISSLFFGISFFILSLIIFILSPLIGLFCIGFSIAIICIAFRFFKTSKRVKKCIINRSQN